MANFLDFKADNLLYACDEHIHCKMPDHRRVLADVEKPSQKALRCKVYMLLCKLLRSHIRERYCTTQTVEAEMQRFMDDCIVLRLEAKDELKPLNNAAKKDTAKNHENRQSDPDDWWWHGDKVTEITEHILHHGFITSLLEDMQKLPITEIRQKYGKYTVRQALMLLLLMTGNGQRPHVTANMRESEFRSGKTEDDIFSVAVWEHKTSKQGVALLGFTVPGLKEAVEKYIEVFHPGVSGDNYICV